MAVSIEVTPSGTVGKQVYASGNPVIVESAILTPAVASAAVLVIRDGNASGDVRLTVNLAANTTRQFHLCDHRFDKGMHVKVTPANAKAYIVIK